MIIFVTKRRNFQKSSLFSVGLKFGTKNYLSCFAMEFKNKNLNLDKLSQLQSSIAEQSIAAFLPGQESRLYSMVRTVYQGCGMRIRIPIGSVFNRVSGSGSVPIRNPDPDPGGQK